MRDSDARRAAIVVGLFVALFAVRFVLDEPTYIGATFLLVLPTVLAALWFGVQGGVAVAVTAAVAFFVAERLDPSMEAELSTVVWAAVVRLGALTLVAVLVAQLFARQLTLVRELDEAEAVREALRPAEVVPRPDLELAAHYVPAEQGVGGDFFLTAEGPRGSTVLLVGDVVGKGVAAARRAVFVRTSLVTFAPFEDDPARLLRLANAALIDRAGTSVDYVTAVCVVHRPADATFAWAIAGHPSPLRLEDGTPLDSAGAGQPLGLEFELDVTQLDRAAARGGRRAALHRRDHGCARALGRALRRGAAAVAGRGARARERGCADRALAGGAGPVRAGRGRRRVSARGAESGGGRLRDRPMKKVEPLIALELPAEPHSAKVARDAIAGLDGHLGSVFGDVVLLISELVTNSVRHAGLDATQPLQLSVAVDDDVVRVAVRDPGPGFRPPKAPTDPGHVGGWGLVLVDQLAEKWGVEHDGEANVVWCELRQR